MRARAAGLKKISEKALIHLLASLPPTPTVPAAVFPQLNIRKLLEDSRLPPINVICQKVGLAV
jgi:hypothetical protein